MPLLGQILGFVSVIVAVILSVIGAVYKLTRSIERAQHNIDSRLERIELRIAAVESQNHAFLEVFPKVITGLVQGHVLSADAGISLVREALGRAPIADLLKDIKPTINPLSQADLDQLRSYVQRLQTGSVLTPPEARDFYRISEIITQEYPANQNSWLLFMIGGLLLGLMISDLKK